MVVWFNLRFAAKFYTIESQIEHDARKGSGKNDRSGRGNSVNAPALVATVDRSLFSNILQFTVGEFVSPVGRSQSRMLRKDAA